MSGLGRTVLEIATDDSKFTASVDRAEQRARALQEHFVRTSGEAKKLGASATQLGAALDNVFGTQLEQRARATATAIMQVGGASKLTDSEVKQHLTTLNEWITKAERLGREVPSHMVATRDSLQKASDALKVNNDVAEKTPGLYDKISTRAVALGAAIGSFLGNVAWTAVNKLGSEVGAFIAQGQKLPAVETSFNRLSAGIGQNSQTMMQELRQSTRSMVSDYALMETANKAMLLGLPVTTQSMGEMAEAATKLGRAMGKGPTESLDDLITALGRSSPMILDNLGLTVKVGEANEAYAAKLGKTSEQLTDAEKKTAFYEAAMEAARAKSKELGDQTRTLGEIAEAVWTSIGNHITKTTSIANTQIGKILTSKKELLEFFKLMAMFGSPGAALAAMQARDDIAASTQKPLPVIDPNALARVSETWKFEELQREAERLVTQGLKPLSAAQRELIIQFDKGGLSASEIATKLNAVRDTAGVTEKQIDRLLDTQRTATEAAKKHAQAQKELADQLKPLTASEKAWADAYLKNGDTHEQVAKQLGVSTDAVRRYADELKQAADVEKKWADLREDMGRLTEKIQRDTTAAIQSEQKKQLDATVDAQQKQLAALVEFREKNYQSTLSDTDRRLRQLDLEQAARLAGLRKHMSELDPLYRMLAEQADESYSRQRAAVVLAAVQQDAFRETVEQTLPDLEALRSAAERLAAAFGKDGAASALQESGRALAEVATAAEDLTVGLSQLAAGDYVGGLTNTTAGAMGLVAALNEARKSGGKLEQFLTGFAIGGPIGGLLNMFTSTAGREAVKNFADSFGGFDELRKKLAALGDEGERLWVRLTQGVGRNDPKAAQEAIEAITRALASAEQRTATFNTAIGGLLGRLREMGGGLPATLRTYLDELQRGGQLTEENIALLAQLTGEGEANWEQVAAAVQRYGGDIEKLGGSFQNARMRDQWQQVIDDLDLFKRGGIDAGDAMNLVKGRVIELVQESTRFGTEIPENMKPYIQTLIESGELVDENGEKITDIGKLKFGETLQTSIQNLVDTIKKLIDEFRKVPDAVSAIPRNIDTTVTIRERRIVDDGSGASAPQPVDYAATGGEVTASGIRSPLYLAKGGAAALAAAVGNMFRPRNTDTVPAMLTPGEFVINADAASLLGTDTLYALNAGRMPAAVVESAGRSRRLVVENRVFLDGYEITSYVKQQLGRELVLDGI